MKRLHLAASLGLLVLAAPIVAQSADGKPGAGRPAAVASFIQVSVHTAALGKAAVQEVAVATLAGDPGTKFEVDGDQLTFTHYCGDR